MRQQLKNHLLQQSPRGKRTPLLPRKRSRIGGSSDGTVTGGTSGDNDNVGAVNDSAVNDSTVNDGDIDGGGVDGGGVQGVGVDGSGVNGGSNEQLGMDAIALNNNFREAVGDHQQLRQQMEALISPVRPLMVSPLSTQKFKGVTISYCVKELYNNNRIKNHVLSTGRFTFNSLDTSYVLVRQQRFRTRKSITCTSFSKTSVVSRQSKRNLTKLSISFRITLLVKVNVASTLTSAVPNLHKGVS